MGELIKDYRLTLKVRNNRLIRAIEDVGGVIGGKWCDENGLSYGSVNQLINMTISPLMKSRVTVSGAVLSKTAERLCEVLGKLPEDLWSSEQLYPLERNFSEMEMDYEQVLAMLPNEQQAYLPDFSRVEQEQVSAMVAKAVATLNPQEQRVIQLRFEDSMTLREAGVVMDLSMERVRQIEEKALRKLRHPLHTKVLVDAMDFRDEERERYKRRGC